MSKKTRDVVEEFMRENNIDWRTTSMIAHHYIDCGEREISKLTQNWIEDYYQKLSKEEKELESEGKVSLISPEFTCYLLTTCMKLYQLDYSRRYKILKEWL